MAITCRTEGIEPGTAPMGGARLNIILAEALWAEANFTCTQSDSPNTGVHGLQSTCCSAQSDGKNAERCGRQCVQFDPGGIRSAMFDAAVPEQVGHRYVVYRGHPREPGSEAFPGQRWRHERQRFRALGHTGAVLSACRIDCTSGALTCSRELCNA